MSAKKLRFKRIEKLVQKGKSVGIGHVVVEIDGERFTGKIGELEYRIAEAFGVQTPLPTIPTT